MTLISNAQIIKDVLRLRELDRSVIKAILECKQEECADLIQQYVDLKTQIRLTLMDNPIVKIDDPTIRPLLNKINMGEPFQTDKVIKAIAGKFSDSLSFALDDDEISEIGIEKFYPWYSDRDYIEALYEIGVLVIGITVPVPLRQYVEEARQCYAFQQYNAVLALCRTILEAAVRHTCERKGQLQKASDNVIGFNSPGPRELIRMACSGQLRKKIEDLYNSTSNIIHGRKVVTIEEAKVTFRDTLRAVQQLYS